MIICESALNFADGWNMAGLSEDLLKMGSVVLPSECVVFGDTVEWIFVSVYSRSTLLANSTLATPSLSPNSEFGIVPHYTFCLTLLRFGQAKIAFLDGHVEALPFRELTLPAQSAHRRWHDVGQAPLDRLFHRDAENWRPIRGIDDF